MIQGTFPSLAFPAVLEQFLLQFDEMDHRWVRCWERPTAMLLASAAKLQRDILQALDQSTVTDLSDQTTVVALTLQCLILASEFFEITCSVPLQPTIKLPMDGPLTIIYEAALEYDTVMPALRVRKQEKRPEPFPICSPRIKEKLDYPQHWPTVLRVLLILHCTRDFLDSNYELLLPLAKVADSLNPLLSNLARYYYVGTEGGILMSHRWDEQTYAKQIGHWPVALEAARKIREMWVQDSNNLELKEWDYYPNHTGLDGFLEKVEYFARGFTD
ncbi:hypothetical protein BDW74DRAFT_180829 [Aspergillus multicolor]|uniref:uncharacterized protein n=1 Tax=Aspergillus multicolor TaxID=41759 RepID=UPI003CCE4564